MPITIRPATLDDEQAVLDLIEQLFDPPSRRPPEYSRERGSTGFRWAVSEPHADVLVALDGEKLVGCPRSIRIYSRSGLGLAAGYKTSSCETIGVARG